ncbi:MAG: protein translocase subunit SecDF [Crocinitomicaceae bacterium]|nr:protein translocase subunit SecDF [Crocinitomicaceae bacterium]
MRNKGFFWFITTLLTVVCLYQLSFTWVASSEEKKAERKASKEVKKAKKEAQSTNNIYVLPNNTKVDFSKPEGEEIAKGTFINEILKDKAEKSVYPVFGSTFAEVKKRSLAFGLDLVGGMSVTLEISIPDLVKNYVRNTRSLDFKKPFENALAEYAKQGGNFIEIFASKYQEVHGNDKMYKIMSITEIDVLKGKDTDAQVITFLKDMASSSMEGVEQIMNRRINQFGVAQPNIQKDPNKNRLYVELPGVQDEVTVAEKLQSTANLQFFETYVLGDISGQWSQASNLSKSPYIESSSVSIDTTSADSSKSSTVVGFNQGKSLSDLVKPMEAYAIGSVKTNDKIAVDALLNRKDIKDIFPSDLKFMWSSSPEIIDDKTKQMGYLLHACKIPETGKADVGGKDIKNATTGYDQQNGKITVDLSMTSEGSDKWAQMTSDNVGECVAITMDNVVYSAPRVINAITGGNTQISGTFTIDEAKDLAGLLNGGALPAPLIIIEQTRVGPTIGAENSTAGLISFAIAFALVLVYMFFYYGKSGLVADIALLANIVFIFGSLASFGAVLTLAGIAGIVLTIGMSVDANVLIFERIREEQANGKELKQAIDTGFKKALSSIIDANVTTLLTAIVLKVFGTGPIESFATTLIIGIFTSVFAALVISRLIFMFFMKKSIGITFDTKYTKGAFKNLNINFIGNRKVAYIISTVLVISSILFLSLKGLKPSVEFSGGETYSVKFEKSAENQIEYLKKNIKSEMKGSSVEAKTKSNNYTVEITTNFKLENPTATDKMAKEKMNKALSKSSDKLGTYEIQETRSVSSSISNELISSSALSIILSLFIIFAYIFIRFGTWQYSISAIVALFHDVTIVLGVFALFNGILPFNMDVDQAFIAAILTVIGYSINDTVVVFDRIREELSWKREANYQTEVNGALNSTLSRTVNTSMTTFVVLLIIFIFGGAAIKGFIFALLIGIIIGTYSSLLLASPLLTDLTKKKA